jgi:hypothetical protein
MSAEPLAYLSDDVPAESQLKKSKHCCSPAKEEPKCFICLETARESGLALLPTPCPNNCENAHLHVECAVKDTANCPPDLIDQSSFSFSCQLCGKVSGVIDLSEATASEFIIFYSEKHVKDYTALCSTWVQLLWRWKVEQPVTALCSSSSSTSTANIEEQTRTFVDDVLDELDVLHKAMISGQVSGTRFIQALHAQGISHEGEFWHLRFTRRRERTAQQMRIRRQMERLAQETAEREPLGLMTLLEVDEDDDDIAGDDNGRGDDYRPPRSVEYQVTQNPPAPRRRRKRRVGHIELKLQLFDDE